MVFHIDGRCPCMPSGQDSLCPDTPWSDGPVGLGEKPVAKARVLCPVSAKGLALGGGHPLSFRGGGEAIDGRGWDAWGSHSQSCVSAGRAGRPSLCGWLQMRGEHPERRSCDSL